MLKSKKLIVVPFLLVIAKIVPYLTLYYTSSITYPIESLELLSKKICSSVNIIYNAVFSCSMLELIILLLLLIKIINVTYGREKLLAISSAILTILTMMFVGVSTAYQVFYAMTMFSTTTLLLYLIIKRKQEFTKHVTMKTMLMALIILLTILLNPFIAWTTPYEIKTNDREILGRQVHEVSINELKNLMRYEGVKKVCLYEISECSNEVYEAYRCNLTVGEVIFPITILMGKVSGRTLLVLPEASADWNYRLTLIVRTVDTAILGFIDIKNDTLYVSYTSLPSKHGVLYTLNMYNKVIDYMYTKFGSLNTNYAFILFERRISHLFQERADSWHALWGHEAKILPLKSIPIVVDMHSYTSSITLLYFNWENEEAILLRITY